MASGGSSSDNGNTGNIGGDRYQDDTSTDNNPTVMHGTSIFLLVFLPVITIFGVTFTYLRWRARLAHFRARSQQLLRIGLVTSEVGPAVEDPAPIFNGRSSHGPRLPGYSETSTPQEPPPPYEVPEGTDANSSEASGETQLPPSYDLATATGNSCNDSGSTSNETMVQAGSCEQSEGRLVLHVVVRNGLPVKGDGRSEE